MTANRKRLLASVVALVALLLGVRVGLNSEAFERWFTGAVQLGVQEALGEEVLLGRAELELWPPRASLSGLVVRPSGGGETIATLERGRAWLSLDRNGFGIRLLELDRPVVRLHIDDGVLREFSGVESGGGDELPYDQLIVRGGDFTLLVDDTELSAEGVELRPSLDGVRMDLAVDRVGVQHGDFEQVAEGIRIEDITLRSDRLEVPDALLSFPVARVEGRFAHTFGGAVEGTASLDIDTVELSQVLPFGLEGPLAVDIEVEGDVDSPTAWVSAASEPVLEVQGNRYGLGLLTAWASVDADGVVVHEAGGVWADGFSHLKGRVDWDGQLHDVVLVLEDVSLSDALVQMGPWTHPWVDFRGDLEYHPTGTLDPFVLDGPVDLAYVDLEVAAGPPSSHRVQQRVHAGVLSGALHFDLERAVLEAETLSFDRSRGHGRAELPFDDSVSDVRIDVDLDRADLRSLGPLGGAELQGRGRLQVRLVGPYAGLRATGMAEIRDFGMLGFRVAETLSTPVVTDDWRTLSFPGFQAREGQTRVHGDVDLVFAEELGLETVALVDGQLQDLGGLFVSFEGIEAPVHGTVSLRGPVERLDGEVKLELQDVRLYGEHFDTGRIDSRMDDGTFTLETATLDRPEGRIRARGTVGAGWAMAAQIEGEGFQLSSLDALEGRDKSLAGQLSLTGRVGGTLLAPEPEGVIHLVGGKLRGEALPALTAEFGTETGRLTGVLGSDDGSLQGTGSIELTSGGAWEADATVRRFPAHVFWPVAADGRAVTALVDGAVEATGVGSTGALAGNGHRVNLTWGGHSLTTGRPFAFAWDEEGWALSDLRIVGEGTSVELDASGAAGILDIYARGPVDAVWMAALTDTISRAAGPMEVDVTLRGPRENLAGTVDLELLGVRLRSPAFPHAFEELVASVRGRPDGYRLVEPAVARLGGGSVVVTGVIDAVRWSPTRYDLSATVDGARVDLVDELPPMVGDATLSLTGPADDLLLSGEVQIEDMLFADRIDWEQWTVDWRERHLDDLVDQPSERDPLFALDIAVTADGTARVRNNVGDGRLEADLRMVGDDTRVGMVGVVRMQEGGRAFLHEREFDVTRGELRYVDPYSYDPLVDFVLETDVRATERTYHITYPITGPFSDLSTNPSSDPQLPQVDINALLLFGVTTEDLERTGGAGAALALEGAGLLFAGETSRALDRFGPEALDVFQYTRVDLVTGVSQRGALNSTEWRLLVEQNLAEPLDVTLVGEFSLDDSYLAAERELYDNLYLNVYWSSEQRERSLNIGGAYGADFKVRWESE